MLQIPTRFLRVFSLIHMPYARRKYLGKHPQKNNCLVFITKRGNTPSENQYFSTFQIPLEPRWKILIFTMGIHTFSNENENEASGIFVWGVSQYFFFMHRAYTCGCFSMVHYCIQHFCTNFCRKGSITYLKYHIQYKAYTVSYHK